MARVLRNFRYRNFEEPVFPENIRYLSLLDSIISLDDEFYKFPDSSVPSLQTLCIKWMLRRSSVLFGPYSSSSTDQLLSSLPPGPFDSLPPPLCDLVCDLMLSLREPETSSAPLYCVISPYTRCLCLREPLTQVAAADLEGLLEARVCHLTELTWTSPPMSQRLLDHLIGLASLTTLITEEAVEPANVCRLLQQCSSLRVLKLQEAGCVAALAEQGVTSRRMSPGADFLALREFHYCYTSSVLAEKVLASAPLSQLEKLSLKYQFDDGAPLTLGTLSRCSRLSELELEGFSDVSVPSGLQLPSVRLLRLRGGTCWPRVVHWLLAALPGLKCLQLVELMIRSDLWTRWFRDWRQAGIEVELVGGCSIPPWRRSSIRSHAAAL
ncbi:hypothetical protein FJT64_002090 [Amphibalanus amphitrite]|uniref:Uncharacterized protein n=1 Tax=Amphibalanus amphitrite TaxID=1232801 RepID=A0A6A4WP67_AMPAM|nr:hypothetical protein FJT64_002090 [Amphibalanus amphitrite]